MTGLPSLITFVVFVGAWVIVKLFHCLFSRHDVSTRNVRHYPHIVPYLGLDLVIRMWVGFYKGQFSEGIRLLHVLHGPTFAAKIMTKDYIYTIEPQNIQTITKLKPHNFEKSEWASEAAKHIGNGILLNEGEEWRLSRSTLRPIFASNVADEPTLMEPHVRRLIAQMVALSEDDGDFEFRRLAQMLMLDVVTAFLFGKSTDCLESPRGPDGEEAAEFLKLVRSFDGPSASFIALGSLAWLQLLPYYGELNDTVTGMKAFFRKKLVDVMENMEGTPAPRSPWSVFQMMKANDVSDEQIQSELQNVFFASWDTTSALLANTVYALTRHPRVQERLREEIRYLHGQPPTKQDLNNMLYLGLVVDEALRLYSPVPLHSRRVKVDTMLPRGGGQDGQTPVIVRAGTTIVWSTYSLNRDPRWYGQDWAEFRPERWATLNRSGPTPSTAATAGEGATNSDNGNDESHVGGHETSEAFFMPFGSGPRACLGQKMAKAEVSYVIVRLLQEFPHLGRREEEEREQEQEAWYKPFREAKAVSFCSADGVWVSVDRAMHRELGRGS